MARKILTQLDALKEIVSISRDQLNAVAGTDPNSSSLSDAEGQALVGMASTLDLANWTNTEGNSMQISYYAGVDANNPSGNVDNVQYTAYAQQGTTILTKEYIYDINDRIITIVAVSTP